MKSNDGRGWEQLPKAFLRHRLPARCLIVALLAVSLSGCAGPQWVQPPGLPELSGGWVHLTRQIPASASAFLATSIEGSVSAALSPVLFDLFQTGDLCELLSDVLGVDLSTAEGSVELGISTRGGMALFLYQDLWIGVADLVDPGLMRAALERARRRNPDLVMEWRSVAGDDVLGVWLDENDSSAPRLSAMVSGGQLIVAIDLAREPILGLVDEVLVRTRDGGWGETVLFNPLLAEAVHELGGDPLALYFFEGSALFVRRPWEEAPSAVPGVFGPPPADRRCREVEALMVRVVPHGFGAMRMTLERSAEGTVRRDQFQLFLRLDESYQPLAQTLLTPVGVDPALLERSATAAAFLQVQPAALLASFGDLDDVASCHGLSRIAGLLGQAAQFVSRYPDLMEMIDGLVGAVLIELRSLSRIPYPDLFLFVGAQDPPRLAGLICAAFESELGLTGAAQRVGNLSAVQYRVALLYRLTLFQGASALGLSLGRVPVDWVEAVLTVPETPGDTFFGFYLDGQRLKGAIAAIADVALGDISESELRESQMNALEGVFADLKDLVWMRLSARLNHGTIQIESTRLHGLMPAD